MPPRSGGAGPRIAIRFIPSSLTDEPETFQILPLRTVERDGVVRTGAPTRHESKWTARLEARREDDLLKEIGCKQPGAGTCQKPSPRRHERHRQPVDVLVTASGAGEVPALLRERGGIADDDVPYLAGGGAA